MEIPYYRIVHKTIREQNKRMLWGGMIDMRKHDETQTVGSTRAKRGADVSVTAYNTTLRHTRRGAETESRRRDSRRTTTQPHKPPTHDTA